MCTVLCSSQFLNSIIYTLNYIKERLKAMHWELLTLLFGVVKFFTNFWRDSVKSCLLNFSRRRFGYNQSESQSKRGDALVKRAFVTLNVNVGRKKKSK